MELVKIGVQFPFEYQDVNQTTGLFVRAKVYEVSSGSPIFVSNVSLTDLGDGLYAGVFSPVSQKAYIAIMNVYTDGTYAALDPLKGPSIAETKAIDADPRFAILTYGAFDLAIDLPVAAKIYKLTPSVSLIDLVPLDFVFGGVYFASFLGVDDSSYVANLSVYEDDDFLVIDSNRPSGSAMFELFRPVIAFNTSGARLQGECLHGVLEVETDATLTFTKGDDVVINLIAMMSDGTTVDLTGATFTSSFRGDGNSIVEFPDDQHEVNPDQVNFRGHFTLTLDSADTESIKVGDNNEIVTQIVIDGKTVAFHGRDQIDVLPLEPLP